MKDPRSLPGVSAYTLGRGMIIVMVAAPPLALATFLSVVMHSDDALSGFPLTGLLLYLLISVGAFGIFVLTPAVAFRSRQERRAGYTTMRYGLGTLDQLDPRYGILIRSAGEPLLTSTEFAAARNAAKESARA